jgi:hypothetical protein
MGLLHGGGHGSNIVGLLTGMRFAIGLSIIVVSVIGGAAARPTVDRPPVTLLARGEGGARPGTGGRINLGMAKFTTIAFTPEGSENGVHPAMKNAYTILVSDVPLKDVQRKL